MLTKKIKKFLCVCLVVAATVGAVGQVVVLGKYEDPDPMIRIIVKY